MEIFTGIDIVENVRIKKSLEKYGEKFLKKLFTTEEIKYCFEKKDYVGCLSARFAAKEAFIKAYFQAFGKKLYFNNIEITGKTGKPAEILLHNVELPSKLYKTTLSISHETHYSVAVAIIYTY